MQVLSELKYVLEDMIEPIVKKEDISPTELDNVYKAVKTMNYIETIKAMKEYGNSNEGGSNRGSYRGSYEGGGSNARGSYEGGSNRGSYEGGGSNRGSYNSYARDEYSEDGSYRRGRYSRESGYSRHEEKEQMISKLEKMMQSATSENERQTIMECIRKLDN